MNDSNTDSRSDDGALAPWSICPRCEVRIANGCVYFSHRPDLPSDGKTLARKVCQWAYKADRRDGKVGEQAIHPQGCINPVYNSNTNYGPYDTIPEIPLPRNNEM